MESTYDIDQESARRMLAEGATFFFLGVPPGTDFGIDMKSWNTGQKFKGVKMIPPGLHYVHYSVVNKEGDTAPRSGFIHNFVKSEFVFKKWDPKEEDISMEEIPDEEKERFKANLQQLDKHLAPYPFEIWNKWKPLISKVSVELAYRITPASGIIRSALELVASCDDRDVSSTSLTKRRRIRPQTAEEREEDLLPQLKATPGTELRLTPFPEQCFPDGATPAEITKHSLDSSYVIETMAASIPGSAGLIGELQFAYVCFLVGQSLEAFEHWKRLVGLLCTCDAIIPKRRDIYIDLINSLEAQLCEIPEEFLADIVSNQNFIYQSLRSLFRSIESNAAVDSILKTKSARFKEELSDKFEWDFSDLDEEDDDEAPVVVECD